MNIKTLETQIINLKTNSKFINREYIEELFFIKEQIKFLIENSSSFKEKYNIYTNINQHLDIEDCFIKEDLHKIKEYYLQIIKIKEEMKNWKPFEELESKLKNIEDLIK